LLHWAGGDETSAVQFSKSFLVTAGLLAKVLVAREAQSMAFFNGAGIEALYSGVAKRMASAARILARRRSTGSG
jgi:hypothetical protein